MNTENFRKYLQVSSSFGEETSDLGCLIVKESTIHGIRYFVDGENWIHRITWMFLIALSCGYLSFLINNAYR